VIEPLRMRIRILLELLVHLVLWTTTNEQEFYRLYTMWYHSRRLHQRQIDFRDFFGATNENIALQVKMQDDDLVNFLAEHPHLNEKAWFFVGLGRRERSLKDLLKTAIPLMSPNERSAVGQSYGDIYSDASADIHYGIDDYDHFDQAMKDPSILLVLIDLLAASALARVYQLAGEPDAPFAANVANSLRTLPAADDILQDFKGRAEKGDVVFVIGGLAQVVDARATEYGTRAYQVRFLADAPIPEIELDWFRASHVKVLFPFAGAEAKIRELSGDSELALTFDAWAQSAVNAWNIGLRDQLRGGPRR
jgi:hypothetical protein